MLAPLVVPAAFALLASALRLIDPRVARHRQLHADFAATAAYENSSAFRAADDALATYINEANTYASGYQVSGYVRSGNIAAIAGTALFAGAFALVRAEATVPELSTLADQTLWGGCALYGLAVVGYLCALGKASGDRRHRARAAKAQQTTQAQTAQLTTAKAEEQ